VKRTKCVMQMQLVVRQFLSLKKAERVQAETKMKEERAVRLHHQFNLSARVIQTYARVIFAKSRLKILQEGRARNCAALILQKMFRTVAGKKRVQQLRQLVALEKIQSDALSTAILRAKSARKEATTKAERAVAGREPKGTGVVGGAVLKGAAKTHAGKLPRPDDNAPNRRHGRMVSMGSAPTGRLPVGDPAKGMRLVRKIVRQECEGGTAGMSLLLDTSMAGLSQAVNITPRSAAVAASAAVTSLLEHPDLEEYIPEISDEDLANLPLQLSLEQKLQWLIGEIETRRKQVFESDQHQQALRRQLVQEQKERILAKAREDKEREGNQLKLEEEKKQKILEKEKERRDQNLKKNAERMAAKKLKQVEDARRQVEIAKLKADQKEQRIRDEKDREEKARRRRMVLHRMKREQEFMAREEAATRAYEAEKTRITQWEITQSKLRKKAAALAEKTRRIKELEVLQKHEAEKVLMEEKRQQHEMMLERERKRDERNQVLRKKRIADKRIQEEIQAEERAKRREERGRELQERAREGRKNAAKRVSEDIAALKRENKGVRKKNKKKTKERTKDKFHQASELMQVAGLLSTKSKNGEHRFSSAASMAMWKMKMDLAGPQPLEKDVRESVSSCSEGNRNSKMKARTNGLVGKFENARELESEITRSSLSAGRGGNRSSDGDIVLPPPASKRKKKKKSHLPTAVPPTESNNSIASFLPPPKPSLFKNPNANRSIKGPSSKLCPPSWGDFPLFANKGSTALIDAQQAFTEKQSFISEGIAGNNKNLPVSPLLGMGANLGHDLGSSPLPVDDDDDSDAGHGSDTSWNSEDLDFGNMGNGGHDLNPNMQEYLPKLASSLQTSLSAPMLTKEIAQYGDNAIDDGVADVVGSSDGDGEEQNSDCDSDHGDDSVYSDDYDEDDFDD
jgi:hypothetical protein